MNVINRKRKADEPLEAEIFDEMLNDNVNLECTPEGKSPTSKSPQSKSEDIPEINPSSGGGISREVSHEPSPLDRLLDKLDNKTPVAPLKLPKFTGIGDILQWKALFLLATGKIKDDKDKIRAMSTALKEEAHEWFASMYTSHEHWTLDKWLSAITDQFPTNCRQKMQALKEKKYAAGKDDPRAFVTRIKTRVESLTCCQDHKDKVMTVLKSTMVDHPLFSKFNDPFPGTTEDLIGTIRHLEDEFGTQPSPKTPKEEVCVAKERYSEQLPTDATSVEMAKMNKQLTQLAEVFLANNNSSNAPRRDNPPLRCYYCNKLGHTKRNCRLFARHQQQSQPKPPRYPGNANRSGDQ